MVKKYTLLFLALHCAIAGIAQQLTANSNGVIPDVTRSTQNVIWDQPVASNGNGIVSNYFNLIPGGTYAADDFQLTEQTKIETITVHGFQNAGTLASILTGVDLYIYEDASGQPSSGPGTPGTGIFESVNISISNPALTVTPFDLDGYSFTFDITSINGGDLLLNTGTYWLVVAPRIDRDNIDFSYRWHWYSAGSSIVLSEPMLIDPDDVFLQVSSTWTGISNFGVSFRSLAFTIEGEDNLSTNNQMLSQVSIYPNPAKNYIKIKAPNNMQIEQIKLIDVLGKDMNVNLQNNGINIAHLAKGIYMMKIKSSVGETVRRIIKN